jgi:hypothetical protein
VLVAETIAVRFAYNQKPSHILFSRHGGSIAGMTREVLLSLVHLLEPDLMLFAELLQLIQSVELKLSHDYFVPVSVCLPGA